MNHCPWSLPGAQQTFVLLIRNIGYEYLTSLLFNLGFFSTHRVNPRSKESYFWIGTFYVSMLDTTFIGLGTVCGSSTFLISFKLAVIESLTVRDEV